VTDDDWPRTEEEALAVQDALRPRLLGGPGPDRPATVAGLDVAYHEDGERLAAAIVVLDTADHRVVDTAVVRGRPAFPYVPGLFAFREIPALLAALDRLTVRPEVLICDGHGLAHPRRFGLACHLGVLTGLPSFGVGKTPLVGDWAPPGERRGDRSDLVDGGETVDDMRESGPGWPAAFAEGATRAGADVMTSASASTDLLYFASGTLDLPGAMFTASHNPAQYNGIKLCRAGAKPGRPGHRPAEIRDAPGPSEGRPARAAARHVIEQRTCSPTTPPPARLVDLSGIRPLKVVVDAGNGMGGYTVPAVLGDQGLPIRRSCRCTSSSTARSPTTRPTRSTRPTWSTCRPRPRARRRHRAWPSTATPTAASSSTSAASRSRRRRSPRWSRSRELAKDPGATIIHNLITSPGGARDRHRARRHPVRTRVGHSFIKAEMARDRRGLRRRALGALLLPRLLVRRHRHAGRAARARRAGRAGPAAVELRRVRAVRASGEINSTVDRPGRRRSPRSRSVRPDAGVTSTSSTA
jgi:deoxyribonuclease V